MKLSTAWYGFRDQTRVNYFQIAAALGLKFVEIPLYWHLIEDRYVRLSEASIQDLVDDAERAGVKAVASVSSFDIAGSFDMRGDPIDSSAIKFARAAARRAIDVGSAIGLEVLRITEPSIPADRVSDAPSYMRAYGRAARDLGTYAADHGVSIVIENYGVTSQQMVWLLEAADHPAVGTLFDPCNYLRMGEDPVEALRRVQDRVLYCQFKDAVRDDSRPGDLLFPGSRFPPSRAIGQGDVQWCDLLRMLSTTYHGYIAIEYEGADDVVLGTRSSIEALHLFMEAEDLEFEK